MAELLKILIADDHAIVRQGLRQIVAETEDMTVAGEAETGLDAIRLVREQAIDVVLLDISMPDRNGIDTLKQLKKEHPKLAVLILSMHREDQYAIRALKAGAAGYLTKQSAPAALVDAIRQVARGRRYVSPSLAEVLADGLDGEAAKAPHEILSDREYQTLCLIALGRTPSEIAAALSVSVKTFGTYRTRLLDKMKLKNNVELTHYAIKARLLD